MSIFNPREFILKTIKGMIGNYPDFQVGEYALDWWKIGKLSDDDMVEIETLIEAQYIVPEPPVIDETVIEENTEDNFVDETYNEELPEVSEPEYEETEVQY